MERLIMIVGIVMGVFGIGLITAILQDVLFGKYLRKIHRKEVSEWMMGLRKDFPRYVLIIGLLLIPNITNAEEVEGSRVSLGLRPIQPGEVVQTGVIAILPTPKHQHQTNTPAYINEYGGKHSFVGQSGAIVTKEQYVVEINQGIARRARGLQDHIRSLKVTDGKFVKHAGRTMVVPKGVYEFAKNVNARMEKQDREQISKIQKMKRYEYNNKALISLEGSNGSKSK